MRDGNLMTYNVEMYGRRIEGDWGYIVLRENVKTLKTARLLACQYSKKYGGTYRGKNIDIFPTQKTNYQKFAQKVFRGGVGAEETVWWDGKNGFKAEKVFNDGKTWPIHKEYKVNGRTGEITFLREYSNH